MTDIISETTYLTGQILIAMPGMGDPHFSRSVVYLCAHSHEGAMGLIFNKPAPQIDAKGLMKQLGITLDCEKAVARVYFGGPVENGRGFVLHSAEYEGNGASLKVDAAFSMTATLDILQDMAGGAGPTSSRLMLGYAGWGPGQLEQEIKSNGWLTCDATSELVFETPSNEKWAEALKSLGINPLLLSETAGHA